LDAATEAQRRRDDALAAQKEAENALAEVRRLNADNRAYEAAITANPVLAKSVAARETGKTLVHLLVPRVSDGSAVSRLQKQLQENGYDPQSVEKVSAAPKVFELRYFRASDQDEASRLAELVRRWNYGEVQVKLIKGYESRSRLKQLEIWFPDGEKSALARLIDQMDEPADEVRKQAIQALWNGYRASSEAISQVLNLYHPERIKTLTPNGMYNGLHFLSNTNPRVWTSSLEKDAREAIAATEQRKPGPRTMEQAKKLRELLDGLNLSREK